jgi:hypothetical protein
MQVIDDPYEQNELLYVGVDEVLESFFYEHPIVDDVYYQ